MYYKFTFYFNQKSILAKIIAYLFLFLILIKKVFTKLVNLNYLIKFIKNLNTQSYIYKFTLPIIAPILSIIISINFLFKHFKFFLKRLATIFINLYASLFSFYFTNFFYNKYKNRKVYSSIIPITKKKTNYQISICIPAYIRDEKVKKYFLYMLDKLCSSINSSKLDYEICIFDNASKYKVQQIIKKYNFRSVKVKRSNILLQPNVSWRNSVELASGQYVHIHSCDDYVNQDFYSNVKRLIKTKKVDLIYVKAKLINEEDYENTRVSWHWNWPDTKSTLFKPKTHFIANPMPSSSWILKREFYERFGVTASWRNGLDLDLSFRINLFCKKCFFLYENTIYYRSHSSSGNNLDNPRFIREVYWNLSKVRSLFIYDLSKKELKNYLFAYYKKYFILHSALERLKQIIPNQTKKLNDRKLLNTYIKILFIRSKFLCFFINFIFNLSLKDFILIESNNLKRYIKNEYKKVIFN